MLTGIRGLLNRRPRKGATGGSTNGDSSRSLHLSAVGISSDAAAARRGDEEQNKLANRDIVGEQSIHAETGSVGTRLSANSGVHPFLSRRRSLDLDFERRRSFGHARDPLRNRAQRVAAKHAAKATEKSSPGIPLRKDAVEASHSIAKFPSEPPGAQKADRRGPIFLSRRRRTMRTGNAPRDSALPDKSRQDSTTGLGDGHDAAVAPDLTISYNVPDSNATIVLDQDGRTSGMPVNVNEVQLPSHSVDEPQHRSQGTATSAQDRPESGDNNHSEGGLQRSADEEGFSSPSTHISRDPFLNDSASIPEPSTGDLAAMAQFDDRSRRRQPVDFLFDWDNDLLAQNRNRQKDRDRLRDRGPENGPGRLRWLGDRRQPKPFLKSSGTVHNGSGNASTATAAASQTGAGQSNSHAISSQGSKGSDFVDAAGVYGVKSSFVANVENGGRGPFQVPDEDVTGFQPVSFGAVGFENMGDDDAANNGGSNLGQSPLSSETRVPASSLTTSSMKRRSSVWKLRSSDQDSRSHSEHERNILRLISTSEVAVKDTNPSAAEQLVGSVDAQVKSLDGVLSNIKGQICASRALFTALPSCRGKEYNDLLYSNIGASDAEEAALSRQEAELVYREFSVMERLWDIEAAIFEQQWQEAVELAEALLSEDAAVASTGVNGKVSRVAENFSFLKARSENCHVGNSAPDMRRSEQAERSHASGVPHSEANHRPVGDRFFAARTALALVVDGLTAEIRSHLDETASVQDMRRFAPLLARLGFVEDARRYILVNSEARLLRQLNKAREVSATSSRRHQFAGYATSRLLDQLWETHDTLNVVKVADTASSSQFLCWTVHQVDTVYSVYLAREIVSLKHDIYGLSSLVKSIKRATSQHREDTGSQEIEMVFASRLASQLRLAISTALLQYLDEFVKRAKSAGSAPAHTWQGFPLVSCRAVSDELEKFTRNAAVNVLGIDNSLDALVASVVTVACGAYAARLLESADAAMSSEWSKQHSANILSSLKGTLLSLGEALAGATSVDRTLRSNAGVLWMIVQLKNGGLCGAEGLRTMSQASVPPRPRPCLVAPARNITIGYEKQQQQHGTQNAAPRARESLSDASARDVVREMLNKERFIAKTTKSIRDGDKLSTAASVFSAQESSA